MEAKYSLILSDNDNPLDDLYFKSSEIKKIIFIQIASKVRSTKEFLIHLFARLSAAFVDLIFFNLDSH